MLGLSRMCWSQESKMHFGYNSFINKHCLNKWKTRVLLQWAPTPTWMWWSSWNKYQTSHQIELEFAYQTIQGPRRYGECEEKLRWFNQKRGFIINIKDLPEDEQVAIKETKPNIYIPNSIAWKQKSHSTKVKICWDSSWKSAKEAPPINGLLQTGSATYSMVKTLLMFRIKKFRILADVS